MKKIGLIALFLLISFVGISATHDTQGSGNWGNDSTWVGNSPGYSLGNNTTVNIDTLHIIVSDNTITFTGNDWTEIHIWGDLTIHGNLNVTGNNIRVFVYPTGKFTVTGNIDFSNGANLAVNGDVFIEGDLTGAGGNSNLTGGGNLIVSGTNTSGIKIGDFVGDFKTGTTTTYPAPVLTGEILADNTFSLKWTTNITSPATIIGYQLFKNNDYKFLGENVTNYIDVVEVYTTIDYKIRAIISVEGNSTFTEYSNILTYTNNALPIELLYFTGTQSLEGVLLEWVTLTEINNDYFTIERSINGIDWMVLDVISGSGNSNLHIKYSYIDRSHLAGIIYYRLMQTDYDGAFEKFSPIAVQPLHDDLLNFTYTVKIYDMMGNLLDIVYKINKEDWRIPKMGRPVIVSYLQGDIVVETIKTF